MDQLDTKFENTILLIPKWQQDFVENSNGSIIQNNYISFPSEKATGFGYFLELSPDLSVHIVDIILKEQIRFVRMPSENDFWVIHYDFSDDFNEHTVGENTYRIGYKSKLGFAIIDSKIKSSYVANIGERAYFLRMYIRKNFMKSCFKNVELEKDFKNIFNEKKKMFYYGYIDSRSKVVLFTLKQQNVHDVNYEFLLKSATYKLFGYFIERLNSNVFNNALFLEKDVIAVTKSQEFLLSDLSVSFPGTGLLSQGAGMSVSKYRGLYKNIFGISPAVFFKKEKLQLAKTLLESGDFELVSDVAYELGYNKTPYFSKVYKEQHGELPSSVFKPKLH